MTETQDIWLVANPASGSNDSDALEALSHRCEREGLCLHRRIAFPDEDLPTPAQLDEAGIEIVAVYAGDGTINALITALQGWGGAVLVLPGGTMNLLSQRLHGPRSSEEIVSAVAAGAMRRTRLSIITCDQGDALAGLLVGPATAWSEVREAMRDFAVADLVSGTIDAISESTDGVPVRCLEPEIGNPDGYPLIMLTPEGEGFSVMAYRAETAAELAQQGFAILRRNFREGPHEHLGTFADIRIASQGRGKEGGSLDMLIDGEPETGDAVTRFTLAHCKVDLLATGEL